MLTIAVYMATQHTPAIEHPVQEAAPAIVLSERPMMPTPPAKHIFPGTEYLQEPPCMCKTVWNPAVDQPG